MMFSSVFEANQLVLLSAIQKTGLLEEYCCARSHGIILMSFAVQ